MKHFIISTLALVMLLSAGTAWSRVPVRVHDSTGSVSVVVPKGWRQVKSDFMGAKLLLAGPKVDGFTININMITEKTGTLSLSDYQKASELNAAKIVTGYKYISSTSKMVDGVHAREWVYTAKMGTPTKNLKFKCVYTIRNGKAYVLTFSAPYSAYSRNVKAFDSVVSSLKWLHGKPKHAKTFR